MSRDFHLFGHHKKHSTDTWFALNVYMRQALTSRLQTLGSDLSYVTVQAPTSQRDKCWSANGAYMEVWHAPSATPAPHTHHNQNKVLGIRVCYLIFWNFFVSRWTSILKVWCKIGCIDFSQIRVFLKEWLELNFTSFRCVLTVARNVSYIRHVCPYVSVCSHVLSARLPMDVFPWNLIFGTCVKICWETPSFVTIGQKYRRLYMKTQYILLLPVP
jgi:hypothetical protein